LALELGHLLELVWARTLVPEWEPALGSAWAGAFALALTLGPELSKMWETLSAF
jgi:hypothetical protein